MSPVFLDVKPRLDDDAAEQIQKVVQGAVEQALRNIPFGLTLTPDERLVVEMHRAQRERERADHRIKVRSTHGAIDAALHANDHRA